MFNVLVRGETDKSSRHSSQSDTLVPHHCAHYSNELDNIQGGNVWKVSSKINKKESHYYGG